MAWTCGTVIVLKHSKTDYKSLDWNDSSLKLECEENDQTYKAEQFLGWSSKVMVDGLMTIMWEVWGYWL